MRVPRTQPARPAAAPQAAPAAAVHAGALASAHRVDLPEAIRTKMEDAFGADFSAVKLYESRAVADAGAKAVTQGSSIAFAPGMLDFTSYGGQALLGHELSHVVSQSRGEARGSGLLNAPALEARADREGAAAAAGQRIAAPAAPLSSASAAPAAGPMQAKKVDYDDLKDSYLSQFPHNQNRGPNQQPTPPQRSRISWVDIQKTDQGQPDPRYPRPTYSADTKGVNPAGIWKQLDHKNAFVKGGQDIGSSLTSAGNFTASFFSGDTLEHGVWGAGIKPSVAGPLGGVGALTGAAAFFSKGTSFIRGLRNIKAGGDKYEPWADAFDSLAGAGNASAGTITGLGSLTKIRNFTPPKALEHAANLIKPGQKLIPGLSVATGGISFLTGLYQAIRSNNRYKEIQNQANTLERGVGFGRVSNLTEDQQRMLRTMRQGEAIQDRNRTSGTLKSIAGAFTAAGGAFSLGGLAPVGFALGAIGAAISGANSIYGLWKNRRIRRDVLAQELGDVGGYDAAVADVKAKLRSAGKTDKISDRQAWKIFLESRGKTTGDEKSLYADIRKRRAAHMLQMAQMDTKVPNTNQDDPAKVRDKQMAIQFLENMGIHQIPGGGYAKGARKLLTEKLG